MKIRIYVGGPAQNQSEHECLKVVLDTLEGARQDACVFVNFHAAGRQVDLAVFTGTTTLLVEAKGYRTAVGGDINGPWHQLGPYGRKVVRNAYDQALDAKNALRDEIERVCPHSGYPNAAVVVAPVVPQGSKLTDGDHKVAVVELARLASLLSHPSGVVLTLDQVDTLAKRLKLERVQTAEAAMQSDAWEAEHVLRSYLVAFAGYYGPLAAPLVADRYWCQGSAIELDALQLEVAAASSALLIRGPSGCGKTLLATALSNSLRDRHCVPLFVRAKDFDGQIQHLLDKEAALLDGGSASTLLRAGRLLNRRVVVFVDGYNECRNALKADLTRGLRALARRHDVGLVITSQGDLARSDILVATCVEVSRPSAELKRTLSGIETLEDAGGNLSSLLEAIDSGLEAKLIGDTRALLTAQASRFTLFDRYARFKLGEFATDGIRALTTLAETMVTGARFSVSIREFDRTCDLAKLDRDSYRRVLDSKLLQVRGDRVSFVHELFFAAFAAEAAIRTCHNDAAKLVALLSSPRLASSKTLVVGAIEEETLLRKVLEACVDERLIASCWRGECGPLAQMIVQRRIDVLLAEMLAESAGARFVVDAAGWEGVAIEGTSESQSLADFAPYIPAITEGLLKGQYFNSLLAACKCMDEAINVFARESVGASAQRKSRNAAFSNAYSAGGNAAICRLVHFVHSGGLAFEVRSKPDRGLMAYWPVVQTTGQTYFLIGLLRYAEFKAELAAAIVPMLQSIGTYPYHLQLELLHFVWTLHGAAEPHRTHIVDALEAALGKLGFMLDSSIVDALKSFGALEEEAHDHAEIVRGEIEEALLGEGSEADELAWSLFSRQFDHPFDTAYWEEIQNLEAGRKKRLLTKACRGAKNPYASFLGVLIRQLAEFRDHEVAEAIRRWTGLPDERSVMPQDAVDAFLAAHEVLAGFEVPLADVPPDTSSDTGRALKACGELYYWANRPDQHSATVSAHIEAAQSTLLALSTASAGTLQLSKPWSVDNNKRRSLVELYPALAVAICREALRNRRVQTSYFANGFIRDADAIAQFCVNVLGSFGGAEDLELLRSICDHKEFGATALAAIQRIEAQVK